MGGQSAGVAPVILLGKPAKCSGFGGVTKILGRERRHRNVNTVRLKNLSGTNPVYVIGIFKPTPPVGEEAHQQHRPRSAWASKGTNVMLGIEV